MKKLLGIVVIGLFYHDEFGDFKNSISSSEDTLFKTLFLWGYLPNLFIVAV